MSKKRKRLNFTFIEVKQQIWIQVGHINCPDLYYIYNDMVSMHSRVKFAISSEFRERVKKEGDKNE